MRRRTTEPEPAAELTAVFARRGDEIRLRVPHRRARGGAFTGVTPYRAASPCTSGGMGLCRAIWLPRCRGSRVRCARPSGVEPCLLYGPGVVLVAILVLLLLTLSLGRIYENITGLSADESGDHDRRQRNGGNG